MLLAIEHCHGYRCVSPTSLNLLQGRQSVLPVWCPGLASPWVLENPLESLGAAMVSLEGLDELLT